MERPGQRVAVHFDVKFRRLTIATSRQGAGVTGGTPYGFTVGTPAETPGGPFIKALNEGIKGMGPGQFRRLIVPPEYAYGNQQVRSVQTFFTHRSVSTFDRVGPFQLTGELVLYFGIALQQLRRMKRTFLKMVGGGLARTTVARLVVKKMFIEYVAQSAEGSRD